MGYVPGNCPAVRARCVSEENLAAGEAERIAPTKKRKNKQALRLKWAAAWLMKKTRAGKAIAKAVAVNKRGRKRPRGADSQIAHQFWENQAGQPEVA